MVEVYEPVEWQKAESIQVDSDAHDNMSALLEIDDWAEQHGFVYEGSYTLRQVRRRKDQKKVFRAILIRLGEDELESRRLENARVAAAVEAMPATPPRVR